MNKSHLTFFKHGCSVAFSPQVTNAGNINSTEKYTLPGLYVMYT